MNKNLFHQQAELLISILPYMTKDTDFALHGGTAINFFVRDMPRLSVQSYGVGQKEIGKGQVLYEMAKVLQNYRAEKDNHSEHSVTWHKPLHYSKEPLIEVMNLQGEMK